MSYSIQHSLQALKSNLDLYQNVINIFRSTPKQSSFSLISSLNAAMGSSNPTTSIPEDYYIIGRNAEYMIKVFPELNAQTRIAHQNVQYQSSDWEEPSVIYMKLREQSLKYYLRVILLEKQQRVALWEKDQGSFEKTKEASPGNLLSFESILFSENEDEEGARSSLVSIIVGLVIKESKDSSSYTIGLASIDILNRVIQLASFEDNLDLSTLESILIQLSAKECIYTTPKTELMHEKLKEVLQRSEICFSITHPIFQKSNFENDLGVLLTNHSRLNFLVNGQYSLDPISQEAANCIIQHLDLISDPDNKESFKLKNFDIHTFMRLDASAMQSLNIISSEFGKRSSLFGILDVCQTRMGSRKLESWIRQPLRDITEIKDRQAAVEFFVDDPSSLESMRNELKYIKDLSTILRRLKAKKSSLRDLYNLYEMVTKLPKLTQVIQSEHPMTTKENYEILKRNFVIPLFTIYQSLQNYALMISSSMDLNMAENEHEYVLNPLVDPSLKQCFEEKEDAFMKMEKVGQKLCNSSGIELRIVNIDKNKYKYYCLFTTKKSYDSVKNQKGYKELETRKNGIYFTFRDFTPLAEYYEEKRMEYESLQQNLVRSLVEVSFTYCNIFDQVNELISELDVLCSFAQVSVSNNYIKPEIYESSENRIDLKEARHPMVESEKEFIRNDSYIGKDESRFVIVTGCNMGGKSTYCRQIAIIVLLAQIGSFVPCTSAKISIRDAILCRIGASDALLIGISTFMAEMIEMSCILQNATTNSLVIVDELGRGTSSYDGYALAHSISEYLINNTKCMTLFATHFHELSQLEVVYGKFVKNLHVQTAQSNDNVHMLYQIAPGCSKESFGIEVAKLVGFPSTIIKEAFEKVTEIKERKRKYKEQLFNSKRRKIEIAENFLKEFISIPEITNESVNRIYSKFESI